ncbi:hypothetical protein E2562_034228 [Oryza meyeriana var. granulata]|uniref:Uncharacterized protein n=1 Tax=Oryza meyeriana var. granulata TaxID=110450 RepID=A0A6G1C9K9_9ORYZ|nr:hypothetical protein E2562_034228 [Oryza meyeriana var. granulata]
MKGDKSSSAVPTARPSFFPTRFREALFFFSALFDMLDATTPKDRNDLRLVLERDVLRRAAVGVIAGEGAECGAAGDVQAVTGEEPAGGAEAGGGVH